MCVCISVYVCMGFPSSANVKNLPASAGDVRDTGSVPGLGRPPGGGNGNPLQCSCLENPMGRGAWWSIVHGGGGGPKNLTQQCLDHQIIISQFPRVRSLVSG